MKQFGLVGAFVLMVAVAMSCSKRDSECKALIGSMKGLGKRLAEAQSVTSSENASAEQVAGALRSFAKEASSAGKLLANTTFTLPPLKRGATDVSGAALGLAESAERMVKAADQMKGSDPARYAANIQRTLADAAAANLKRQCASGPTDCALLSRVLSTRPPFPVASVDVTQAAVWNSKAVSWLDDLHALEVTTPELQKQIANLGQTTKAYAAALSTLAGSQEAAEELAAATKEFSAQIEAVSAVMTTTQSFCKP